MRTVEPTPMPTGDVLLNRKKVAPDGLPATVVGGGFATIAIVGVWWIAFPWLPDVDRLEDPGH